MCHLRCDYEAEFSEKCRVDVVQIKPLPTWGYVKWLEATVEKFTSTNKQSTPCDDCSHWVTMCEHHIEYGSHDCKVLRR